FYQTFALPPTTFTVSLHDALPILRAWPLVGRGELEVVPHAVRSEHVAREAMPGSHKDVACDAVGNGRGTAPDVWVSASGRRRDLDRKSTRLNSSHVAISYAVFCLK